MDTAWAGCIEEIKHAIKNDLRGDFQRLKLEMVENEIAIMKGMLQQLLQK